MVMDAGEICRSYAAAKNKNDQILILADLNDCKPQEILDVLTEGGMISGLHQAPKRKPLGDLKEGKDTEKRATPLKWTPELDRELIRYCKEDMAPMEVAERMGLDVAQVKNRKNRLKRKGYLFDLPDRQPPKANVPEACEEQAQVASPAPPRAAEEDAAGTNPLGMLYDSLLPDLEILSAAVEFRDDRGECWRLQMMRMEG